MPIMLSTATVRIKPCDMEVIILNDFGSILLFL